jgi:hypothetical protein
VGGGPPRAMDGEGRNRTADTTIFSRVLYQLSYLAGRVRLVGNSRRLQPAERAAGAYRTFSYPTIGRWSSVLHRSCPSRVHPHRS